MILLLAAAGIEEGNIEISSFLKSKKILLNTIYSKRRITFYCGCSYTKEKKVDWDSCGYIPKRENRRARRIEWEHVVPAHAFGQSFPEWRKGHPDCVTRRGKRYKGRHCAQKVNRQFKYMQADMYNLYPAIGEVNGARSNYSMAMIPGEERRFGDCDIEIKNKKVEPPPSIRGDIARTYQYMNAVYPGRGIISKKNRKLFKAWDRADPVDTWECERTRIIAGMQGNRNEIVVRACIKAGLYNRL
ncbi:MAG: endonuclease I [bacterium]|nr:endonuclease I [bacterium]